MSTTSEALAQLAEQKEALRVIANRYLDNADKLAVNCTLQDIIDVLDEYDEYSYMNVFLNSIEVFPDKDYSINDTEGHIKGLRNYAFYNNTALKSINCPATSGTFPANLLVGCSNLERVILGYTTITSETNNQNNVGSEHTIYPYLRYAAAVNAIVGSCKHLSLPSYNFVSRSSERTLTALSDIVSYIFSKFDTVEFPPINQTRLIEGVTKAIILPCSEHVATIGGSSQATSFSDIASLRFYVPTSLLSTYQAATNWVTVHQSKTDEQGNYNGIQDIESNLAYLRELGIDFSYTPYANKKWENNQLVDDPTIGEEVDE